MSDHLNLGCPHCLRDLRVRAEYLGRKVVCKFCDVKFVVRAASSEQPDPALASPVQRKGRGTRSREPESRTNRLEDPLSSARRVMDGLRAEQGESHARDSLTYETLLADRDRLARELETLRAGAASDPPPEQGTLLLARLASERDDALAERDRMQDESRSLGEGLTAAHEVIHQMSHDLETLLANRERLEEQRKTEARCSDELAASLREQDRLFAEQEADLLLVRQRLQDEAHGDRQRHELTAELDSLRDQLKLARRECAELALRLDATTGELEALGTAHDVHKNVENVRREVEAELQAVVERLTRERDRLHQQCREETRLRAERDEQAAALRADLEANRCAHQARSESYEQTLSALRHQGDELTQAREHASRQKEAYRQEAERERSRADDLGTRQELARKRLAELQTQNQALASQVQSLQAAERAARRTEALAAASRQDEIKSCQVADLTRQVKTLKAQIRSSHEATSLTATLRPRPEAEPEHDPHSSKAALEDWLDDAQEALAETGRQLESLTAEVQSARSELELLNMDLALSEWDEPEIAFPFEES